MRQVGRMVVELLTYLEPMVQSGVSTLELNNAAESWAQAKGVISSFLGYNGYPASICTSVNEKVCNAIPRATQILRDGDIINITIALLLNGFHGKTSRTFFVGEPSQTTRKLVMVAEECLRRGIGEVKPGARISDIATTIQEYVESEGFSVVRDYTGHGIGRNLHVDPTIPHYFDRSLPNVKLRPGMVFSIQPMINEGTWEVEKLADKFTAVTKDRKLSAQFEHMVLVTSNGVEVLTLFEHPNTFLLQNSNLAAYINKQAVTIGQLVTVPETYPIQTISLSSQKSVSKNLGLLPTALAQMHRLGIYPPLSLIQDLLDLTGGQPVNNPLAQLAQDTGVAELIALRWSTPARIGLVALLLHKIPFSDWEPPSDISPREISNALQAGLKGEPMEPQAPPPPISPLQEAAKLIDEQLLSLLTILGEQAVAAEPALPLRLLSRIPNLPALSSLQRQLLGVRVCFGDHRGRSIGNAPGAERGQVSGVETSSRTDWSSLLPSQLALPKSVLNYRYQRGELLFRTRELAEPPRLRPTVLLLDVTPPAFGPIEAITRISAFAVANFLRQAEISVVLITNGEEQEQILQLDNPEDLVEIWTHRAISPANEIRSLKLANAIRTNLRDESGLEPIILLLTHPWFGAEAKLSRIPGLRGLFVQYPSMQIQPTIANLCDRYSSIDVEQTAELGEILGYLMG